MNRNYKRRSNIIIGTYLLGLLGMLLIIGIIMIDREDRSESIKEITYSNFPYLN